MGQLRKYLFWEIVFLALLILPTFAPEPLGAVGFGIVVLLAVAVALVTLFGGGSARRRLAELRRTVDRPLFLVGLEIHDELRTGVLILNDEGPTFDTETDSVSWNWSEVESVEIGRETNLGPEYVSMELHSGDHVKLIALNRLGTSRAGPYPQDMFFRAVRRAHEDVRGVGP
jgi:hypothetical protein